MPLTDSIECTAKTKLASKCKNKIRPRGSPIFQNEHNSMRDLTEQLTDVLEVNFILISA